MPNPLTVSSLSDHQLLASAKDLARRERSLNMRIIEHLREIGSRGLHLRHGYGSLFDYAVKELGFGESSAYQRLQALKLSDEFPEVKQDLEEGELTLTAAGYLQSAFDRDQRRRRQLARDQQRGGAPVAGGMPGEGGAGAEGELQPDASRGAQAAGPEATPLNAAAKRELIERARGKSTRQVRELIAEFDPELVRPRDRLRALGQERWELKAVIDGECRRGLEQLRHWLSHVNPSMDFGELLQRLVADAVVKYDPAREPARARRQASATVASAAGAGSRGSELRTRKAKVVAAPVAVAPRNRCEPRNGAAKQQPGGRRTVQRSEQDATSRFGALGAAPAGYAHVVQGSMSQATVADGRIATAEPQPTEQAPARRLNRGEQSACDQGGPAACTSAAIESQPTAPPPASWFDRAGQGGCSQAGSAASVSADAELRPATPVGSPPANAEPGGCDQAGPAVGTTLGAESQRRTPSTGSPLDREAPATTGAWRGSVGSSTSAQKRGGRRSGLADCGGGTTSAQKRGHPVASRDGAVAGCRTTSAQKRDRGSRRIGVTGRRGASGAQRCGDAGGLGDGGPSGPRLRATVTRAIPAAVRRHIWLRDRGQCTFRDPETGRCCGSRHLLQIDQLQPFAMGGANSEDNLRLLCAAHNRGRGSGQTGGSE